MAELLGQCSSTASDGGQDLQVQTRVFPSRLLSSLAAVQRTHSSDSELLLLLFVNLIGSES